MDKFMYYEINITLYVIEHIRLYTNSNDLSVDS